MNVAELIKLLNQYPQELQVAYRLYSEQVLLEADHIGVAEACEPRADGWIQDKRPDMPSQKYLILPGN